MTESEWEIARHRAMFPRLYENSWYQRQAADLREWVNSMKLERNSWRVSMGLANTRKPGSSGET